MRPPPPASDLGLFFTLLLSLLLAHPVWSAEPAPAAPVGGAGQLYKKHCAVCHGKSGDGKSSAARGMTPPPTDFTSPEALVDLSRERMLQSVAEGRPHTAMVSWKGMLSPDEMAGVVDYIRTNLMLASRASDATQGRRLFAKKCSVCHGDRGDVAVWARGGLVPPPRDFTTDSARWELTRERMLFSVSYGRPETAMPSWLGRLSKEEIDAVVSYIRSAFMFPEGEGKASAAPEARKEKDAHAPGGAVHEHDHYQSEDMLLPLPNGLRGDVEWGKKFYKNNCAACHGEKGDGKGVRSDFVYPKPRDFLHPSSRHKLNRPHLFEVIGAGTRGTEMPAWSKVLTEQEIANLAEFVFQTFVRPDGEGAPASPAQPAGHDHAGQGAAHDQHGHHAQPGTDKPAAPPAQPAQPAGHDHTGQGAAHDQHGHHAQPGTDKPAAPPAQPAQPAGHDHAGQGAHDQHGHHAQPGTDKPAAPPAQPAQPAGHDHAGQGAHDQHGHHAQPGTDKPAVPTAPPASHTH
ncbi:MAG: c-type cytochrome [Magnetococcales bacterium]|nr:c-type cytochrome [Magnetococcales bacterium]